MFDLPQINYNGIIEVISPFFSSLRPVNIIEFLVLGFLVYKIYRYIAGTQAEQLLKGILMLLSALLLSKLFNFQIIGKVLESVVNIVIFSLVVIFQPELRRFLGYLGQRGFFSRTSFTAGTDSDIIDIIKSIADAVKHLSKSHTGALIVFSDTPGTVSTPEVGTKLNAKISTELLLTIFHPNTPLHDGAVVISGDKIHSSGVLLPLTEDPKLSWQYGTRHRAAIGMSEISDASCIVVSEETGKISLAQEGKLIEIKDIEHLKKELGFIYGISEPLREEPKEKIKKKKKFKFKSFFFPEFSKQTGLSVKKEEKLKKSGDT